MKNHYFCNSKSKHDDFYAYPFILLVAPMANAHRSVNPGM